MLTLEDLEAAFDADLNLATARKAALAAIAAAVREVTALGFAVKIESFRMGNGGGLVQPVFCLDEYPGPVMLAEVIEFTGTDLAEIDATIREFIREESSAPADSPGDGLTFLFSGTFEDHEDKDPAPEPDLAPPPPAAVTAPVFAPAKPSARVSEAKTDYHSRYAGLKPGTDPLSPEDRATIIRLHASGANSGRIAAVLGRDPRGFYHRINEVVGGDLNTPAAQVPAEAAPTAGVPSAPAAPVAEVAASVPAESAPSQETGIVNPVDAPPPGRMTDADKRLDARLDALGNKGKWADPADDLYLVEELAKGARLAVVALELNIDAKVCKMRFDELVPTKSPDEQAAVVKALRRRAVAARSRAA